MSEYKPMGGRIRKTQMNCENPVQQKISGKRGMKAKLDSNALDALWAVVQLHTRMTFRWTPKREN